MTPGYLKGDNKIKDGVISLNGIRLLTTINQEKYLPLEILAI